MGKKRTNENHGDDDNNNNNNNNNNNTNTNTRFRLQRLVPHNLVAAPPDGAVKDSGSAETVEL